MRHWPIILVILPTLVLAAGPKYTYPDVRGLDDEMNNIYHDIKYPYIVRGTINGVVDGSNACTGCLGEYISQDWSNVNLPTSLQWGDATSITLTAGDWDVMMSWSVYTLGTSSDFRCGISVNSGNNSAGLVYGDNFLELGASSGNIIVYGPMTIANYRMSLTSTTTVYAKQESNWSVQPTSAGRISARRIR